jgi:cytochrome c oxidase subunit II
MAQEIDYLHYSVILMTMAGASLVAAVAAYFMFRYRRSKSPAPARTAVYPEPPPRGLLRWLEFGAGGVLLLMFVGWWVVGFNQFVRLEVPPPGALEIYAYGKQWMWTFAYPNGHGSKGVLYVPVNRPVKLVMNSGDVIHSFYVPDFRVKKDVVPGRATTLWFEANAVGSYPAYCAEYCGEGHSTMRAQVSVLSDAEYAAAIEEAPNLELAGIAYQEPGQVSQEPRQALSLAQMGERVAVEKGCTRCHTVDGTPHIGPPWTGLYGASVALQNGEVVLADAAYLTESMMDPMAKIHRGYPALMPSYQGLLSAGETGALLEYVRALAARPPLAWSEAPLAPAAAAAIVLPAFPRGSSPGAPPPQPPSPPELRASGSVTPARAQEPTP